MCIVIDACCLTRVFDPGNRDHADFAPVSEWLSFGKGKMIYGGTRYKKELSKLTRILSVIVELRKAHKAINVDDSKVDEIEKQLRKNFTDSDFNDQHLVAIVIVSRCHVVCTVDRVATVYLKRIDLFQSYKVRRPKIYKSRRNRNLCCDKYLI